MSSVAHDLGFHNATSGARRGDLDCGARRPARPASAGRSSVRTPLLVAAAFDLQAVAADQRSRADRARAEPLADAIHGVVDVRPCRIRRRRVTGAGRAVIRAVVGEVEQAELARRVVGEPAHADAEQANARRRVDARDQSLGDHVARRGILVVLRDHDGKVDRNYGHGPAALDHNLPANHRHDVRRKSGDERDHKFARHFNLPITNIIGSFYDGKEANPTYDAVLENSDFLNGMKMKDAMDVVIKKVEERGIGKRQVNYKMRDAGWSRQRYWGEPFPVVFKDDVPYAMKDSELPLQLPPSDNFKCQQAGFILNSCS